MASCISDYKNSQRRRYPCDGLNKLSSIVVPLRCMPRIKTGLTRSAKIRAARLSFDLAIKSLFTVRNKASLLDCNGVGRLG
jgi:hypothetical protein